MLAGVVGMSIMVTMGGILDSDRYVLDEGIGSCTHGSNAEFEDTL